MLWSSSWVESFPSPRDVASLEDSLLKKFNADNSEYGVLGLHTCGDLGPILVRLFAESDRAAWLQSVGCCYMYLKQMLPMSAFLHRQPWRDLSYVGHELSCHAIEVYAERLRRGEAGKLKVHCYRALLEKLFLTKCPGLRHKGLRTVTRAHEKEFADYVRLATAKLELTWEDEEFSVEIVTEPLSQWWRVVAFYSLKLVLAPVIETVLLLDRCLYLHEKGCDSALVPIFDPSLSPRNHVLVSVKNK